MSDEFARVHSEMQERVIDACAAVSDEIEVCYSAYECAENPHRPVDNLDEVPVTGKVKVVAPATWCNDAGENYESDILESPTYLELAVLANESIKVTGDRHHIFFEGVLVRREEDGVKIVEMYFGS